MVTSLLLMANKNQEVQQQMMKQPRHGSSSEETKINNNEQQQHGRTTRGRKGSSVKGPKKQPMRGLGVAQLERLRVQEHWKKMNESSSSSPPSSFGVVVPPNFPDQHHHQNFLHCHPQMLHFPLLHDPFENTSTNNSGTSCGGVPHPVRYCAAPPPPPQGQNHGVITGQGSSFMGTNNNNNNKSGLTLDGSSGGWIVPNQMNNNKFGGSCGGSGGGGGGAPPFWSPFVGTPLVETSRELSSMPNLHSHHEFFDVFSKKTRFNEESVGRGSNSRKNKDKPLDIWPNNNGPEFLGYTPQSVAPNQTSADFYYKPADDVPYYNHDDEGVEVVAVHRKGKSVSGRVFMEYEFFPSGKDNNASGTASKDLESPKIRGEASSIIRNTAFNCDYVDLSLKLSR